MRILRLMQVMTNVKDLAITVGGLAKSMRPLAWIVVVLFMICYAAAIYFATVLEIVRQPNVNYPPAQYWGKANGNETIITLGSSIQTMIEVIVVNQWTNIFEEDVLDISEATKLFLIYLPFYAFALIAVFGISNIIIGVIVDATKDIKDRLGWCETRDELVRFGELFETRLQARGLSLQALENLKKEVLSEEYSHLNDEQKRNNDLYQRKVKERRDVVNEVISDIASKESHIFPRGITAEQLRLLFDEDGDGFVSHQDLCLGLGRLLLCNGPQQRVVEMVNLRRIEKQIREMTHRFDQLEQANHKMFEANQKIFEALEELKGTTAKANLRSR